jgi:PHD/YefM family antitoxin component YafN of YafNO toxin-antitoxin module
MRQVNAIDFKTHFGDFVELLRDEPITVLRGGRPVGVFISSEQFEHLQRVEDACWAVQGEAAVGRADLLSPAEAMRWRNEKLAKYT